MTPVIGSIVKKLKVTEPAPEKPAKIKIVEEKVTKPDSDL